jgi:hypothetical protein
MAMGVVDIENIELFLTKILGEVQNVMQIFPEKEGMINFY